MFRCTARASACCRRRWAPLSSAAAPRLRKESNADVDDTDADDADGSLIMRRSCSCADANDGWAFDAM
eukprot:3341279-Pleurochrysis_carterae.AAC.1